MIDHVIICPPYFTYFIIFLYRALSYGDYPSRDSNSSQQAPDPTAAISEVEVDRDPKNAPVRQLSRPKIPAPSPYAYSSLPFMKAPLLRSTASTKTVHIASDPSDAQPSNIRKGAHEEIGKLPEEEEEEVGEEGEVGGEESTDRERTIAGCDSGSGSGSGDGGDKDRDRRSTPDYLFSVSGQEQSLYYYRNQFAGDVLNSNLEELNDDDLQAAMHLLEDSVCTETTRTPGGSIGEQTPIMAISPFDPHASPGSMYFVE